MGVGWTRTAKRQIAESEGCGGNRCSQITVGHCDYVDLWGWKCDAPFCSGHGVDLVDGSLCLEHAALFYSVGGDEPVLEAELADVYGQTPSLLRWVSRGIDLDIREMLTPESEEIPVGFEQRVLATPTSSLRWEAEWWRDDIDVRVGLVVEDGSGPSFTVMCKFDELYAETPEWLLHHRLGMSLEDEQEQRMRSECLGRVAAAVSFAVTSRTPTVDVAGVSDRPAKVEVLVA